MLTRGVKIISAQNYAGVDNVGSYGLIGTVETIRQRLAAYEEAGVQELVISFSDVSHLDDVHRFAQTFIR